jgi:hypothetical protein
MTGEPTNERSRRYAWQRNAVFRVAAATPLGIVLIAAVVVVLAWGTLVGARTSLDVALRTVYGAIWFQVLLGALALNLVCCTLKAMPYRWSHVGFLVTHLSLLLVFAGAILTTNFATRGEVRIAEGGRTSFYFDPALVRFTDTATGRSAQVGSGFEAQADRLREHYTGTVDARAPGLDGVSLAIDRYYPDAAVHGPSVIEFGLPRQNVSVTVAAVVDPESAVPIKDTGYTLTVQKAFYDWKDGREAGGPDAPDNPAVRVRVHTPDGDADLVLFAQGAVVATGHRPPPEGVSLRYRFLPASPLMRGWQRINPAIRVTARDGDGHHESIWVSAYERGELTLGARTIAIEYPKRVPLGFSLGLDKFVARQHPHSSVPASFESHLTVDAGDGERRPAHVAMNAPATIGGYTLYQSDFGRDPETGRPLTVLALSRDPGTNVLYVGFGAAVAGLITTFYVSPVLRRREQARRTARTEARGEEAR